MRGFHFLDGNKRYCHSFIAYFIRLHCQQNARMPNNDAQHSPEVDSIGNCFAAVPSRRRIERAHTSIIIIYGNGFVLLCWTISNCFYELLMFAEATVCMWRRPHDMRQRERHTVAHCQCRTMAMNITCRMVVIMLQAHTIFVLVMQLWEWVVWLNWEHCGHVLAEKWLSNTQFTIEYMYCQQHMLVSIHAFMMHLSDTWHHSRPSIQLSSTNRYTIAFDGISNFAYCPFQLTPKMCSHH